MADDFCGLDFDEIVTQTKARLYWGESAIVQTVRDVLEGFRCTSETLAHIEGFEDRVCGCTGWGAMFSAQAVRRAVELNRQVGAIAEG